MKPAIIDLDPDDEEAAAGRFLLSSLAEGALNPFACLRAHVSDHALGAAPSNLALDQELGATANASRDRVNRFRQKQKGRWKLDRQELSVLISDFDGPNQGCRMVKRASVIF